MYVCMYVCVCMYTYMCVCVSVCMHFLKYGLLLAPLLYNSNTTSISLNIYGCYS